MKRLPFFNKADKANVRKYKELLADDNWYNKNKGKYVGIIKVNTILINETEAGLLEIIKKDYSGKPSLIQLIDRNPVLEPLPASLQFFEKNGKQIQ